MDYRLSHLHPKKGKEYHDNFLNEPYLKMVWQLEKTIIDNVLSTFFINTEVHHLDFACGTGRILSYLEEKTTSSVGIDISPSMIEMARENCKSAEIINADLTLLDVLGERKFNLITAFRFFPNAQSELRKEVMHLLKRHLQDEGYFVFNNHKNTGSSRNRLARLCGHRNYKGMSILEIESLLSETGLKIEKVYHLCIFPASDKHLILPVPMLRLIEVFLMHIPIFRKLGENLIFVCTHLNSR